MLKDITENKQSYLFIKNVIGCGQPSQPLARELSLEDYLLFSETSLEYQILVKESKELPEIYGKNKQIQYIKPKLIVCSICHLTVKGLVYTCHACGHGGHYDHLMEWVKLN